MIDSWIVGKAIRTHPLNASGFEKVFAVLQAYMDDSGTHDGSHNCVVAGYWGGVNEWRRFERAWKAVLAREGISEFKANQFWPRFNGERIGPYRGWTNERHVRFIGDLLRVIFNAKIYPFGSGVLAEEWEAQPLRFRQVITIADLPKKAKPMLVSFQRNVYRAASYCYPGVRMHFVFDECGAEHVQSSLARCFRLTKEVTAAERHPIWDKLGSISFEDSAIATPLQAADLLAYEMHRFAKQKVQGLAGMRDAYKIALLRMKSIEDFWLFDQPRFKRMKELFPEEYERGIESRIENIQCSDESDFEGGPKGSKGSNGG